MLESEQALPPELALPQAPVLLQLVQALLLQVQVRQQELPGQVLPSWGLQVGVLQAGALLLEPAPRASGPAELRPSELQVWAVGLPLLEHRDGVGELRVSALLVSELRALAPLV